MPDSTVPADKPHPEQNTILQSNSPQITTSSTSHVSIEGTDHRMPQKPSLSKRLVLIFIILTSIALICVTIVGFTYFSKTSEKIVSQTPRAVSPTAIASIAPIKHSEIVPLDNAGTTYKNNTYGFTFTAPPGFEIYEQDPHTVFAGLGENDSEGFLYISVIPENTEQGIYNYDASESGQLLAMRLNETKSIRFPEDQSLKKYWTYTRVSDTDVNGLPAKSYMNYDVWEGKEDDFEKRLYLELGSRLYVIGAYLNPKGFTEEEFDMILSTLNFTNDATR